MSAPAPSRRPSTPSSRRRPSTLLGRGTARTLPLVRVLFVASPMVGHVLPLAPLAAALRDAGHDVLFATAEDGVGAAEAAGLPVRDVAPGLRIARVLLLPALRRPLLLRRELAGR